MSSLVFCINQLVNILFDEKKQGIQVLLSIVNHVCFSNLIYRSHSDAQQVQPDHSNDQQVQPDQDDDDDAPLEVPISKNVLTHDEGPVQVPISKEGPSQQLR